MKPINVYFEDSEMEELKKAKGDKTWHDFIMNAPVVFGLQRQGHIPTIKKMLKEGATWEDIGKEIGWYPETAKEHYGWYVESRGRLKNEKKNE